ncbi:MAG: hypothetical protein KAW91_05775 [candidate division Zixibacteria bacterium]|nr:hypothetical protein [candidate division Zixibacteria bacterium]
MREKIALAFVLVFVMAANGEAAGAFGSSFGTLWTARSLGMANGSVGLGIGAADHTSFVGFFKYGLSDYTDGRILLGIADDEGVSATVVIGADFKYQLLNFQRGGTDPFDLAIGALAEYLDLDNLNAIQIGGHVIGSYPVALKGGTTLSPYGRINVRLERTKRVYVDRGGEISEKKESELKFGLNMGVCWDISRDVGLYGEFQFDGNDGIFLGVSYSVL